MKNKTPHYTKPKEEVTANIHGIFPTPLYFAINGDSDLDSAEEIEDIIKEGIHDGSELPDTNKVSDNSYIFNNDKLKSIKQFCEQHIKLYVKEVMSPEEELEFYITQSWVNVTEPGKMHHPHTHPNSVISGVYYVATVEDDIIVFKSPPRPRNFLDISIPSDTYNIWNSLSWELPVHTYDLILFPSWLEHLVVPNPKATTDRISISFNTFIRGNIGRESDKTELILK